jgi:hypothetical protein
LKIIERLLVKLIKYENLYSTDIEQKIKQTISHDVLILLILIWILILKSSVFDIQIDFYLAIEGCNVVIQLLF